MQINVEFKNGSWVQLKLAGAVKRSTLETSQPDPEWEAVSDVRNWSWCCRLQAERLRSSFRAEFPWSSKPRQDLSQERRFATTSYDVHCFLVAAANLDRALQRSPKALRRSPLSKQSRRAILLLRNIYEHWDELRRSYRAGGPKTGAALKLSKEFPAAEPWTLQYYTENTGAHRKGDIVVAGVVSLDSLKQDLRKLEARSLWRLRELRRQGRHVAAPTPNNGLQRSASPRAEA